MIFTYAVDGCHWMNQYFYFTCIEYKSSYCQYGTHQKQVNYVEIAINPSSNQQSQLCRSLNVISLHQNKYRQGLQTYAEFLLKHGADITHLSINSEDRCMHHAARLSQSGASTIAMMELLLKNGAQINWTNKQKRTALHLAVNANKGTADASAEVSDGAI